MYADMYADMLKRIIGMPPYPMYQSIERCRLCAASHNLRESACIGGYQILTSLRK